MKILISLTCAPLLALFVTSAAAQEIYKTVDKDGNVIYTDQPPSADAKPMDLPPITVADPYDAPPRTRPPVMEAGGPEVFYADLRLVAPEPEQHFWGTGGTFTARVETSQPLQAGHQVRFYLDGNLTGSTNSFAMDFNGIDRGQHSVRAEVVDVNGEVMASTEPVIFFMRQQSVLRRSG
ncbi:MAG: DUF4124 domain-containing protein [Pseudomonadota bacterium]